MKYVLTEQEINNKGYWDRYSELHGVGHYTTPDEREVSFTQEEYNFLIGATSTVKGKQEVDDSLEMFDGVPWSKFGEIMDEYNFKVSIGFGDPELYIYYEEENHKDRWSKNIMISIRNLGVTTTIKEVVTGKVELL